MVRGGQANGEDLYCTIENDSWSESHAIRPVVDIDLSKVIISDSGNGYSIDPKS